MSAARERDRRLPVGPLQDRLRIYASEHHHAQFTQHELQVYGLVGPVMWLSNISGVSDRTIRTIIQGHRPFVLESTADKILTALGEPLSLVYGP